MPRVHCIVKGRVQGVGFRYFVQRSARNHGVNGWVRNLWGGAVEAEAEGSSEALQKFVDDLKRGPALAQVLDLDIEWLDQEAGYTGFEVRPTES